MIETNSKFTISQTNIVKGIACLMLLITHLFNRGENLVFFINSNKLVTYGTYFSDLCAICVPLFLFMSGYGMNEKLNGMSKDKKNKFTFYVKGSASSLFKLYAMFLVIFILFVPWQPLIHNFPNISVKNFIFELLGIRYLLFFEVPQINATWWYLGIAIFAYLVTPFFKWLLDKCPYVMISVAVVIYAIFYITKNPLCWVAYYFYGMIVNQSNLINVLTRYRSSNIFALLLLFIVSIGAVVYFRGFSERSPIDFLLIYLIIVFSYLVISRIKGISDFLCFVGKHSANIFFFHTFLRRGLMKYVYAPKYSIFVFVIFLAVCLLISVLIEFLKKITRYSDLVRKIDKIIRT